MTPKLSSEQRDALSRQPAGEPLPVLDDETQQVYFLVDRNAARDFAILTLRRELEEANNQADAGEIEPWDVQSIIDEGERRLAERQPPA